MPTRIENLFRMRDLLDNPLPQKPSFHSLMRQELAEEQDVVNATNNSAKPWAVNTYQLNHNGTSDTYTINVSDFGKVMYVARISGNVNVPYTTVPFDDVNNQQFGRIASGFYGSFGNISWLSETPEHMSFYREGVLNAEYKVKIQPAPAQSWSYLLYYLPGYIGVDDPLTAGTQLPEFAELVRLRGAMAQLNYSEWFEDFDKNRIKRKDLAEGFLYQLDRKERAFSQYIKSIAIPKTVTVEAWNS